MSALAEIAGEIDPSLRPYTVEGPGPAHFVGDDPGLLFVLETVYEGHLLHHGEPRVFRGMDADLRLLAGDALYALGLERLAGRGDLDAVAELADLITLCAAAHAEGAPGRAEAAWRATAERLHARAVSGAPSAPER